MIVWRAGTLIKKAKQEATLLSSCLPATYLIDNVNLNQSAALLNKTGSRSDATHAPCLIGASRLLTITTFKTLNKSHLGDPKVNHGRAIQ